MTRPIPFVAALVLIGTSVGVAQQKRVVTAADYDRAVKMLAPALNGLVVGDTVTATWLPDGSFWYARTTPAGTENIVIDPVERRARRWPLRQPAARPRPARADAAGAAVAVVGAAGVGAASRSRRRAARMSRD